MNKLPLVFVEKKIWESWISIFDAWERGELIGDDGKDPTIISRLPRAHITKTDVAPTLGLRDSDLRVIMNELMWKHRQYRLPCKDTNWVPYDDAAWEALCEEKDFTLTIVRNTWKDMMHYTEGAN
jgi:hypothetical protein